MGHVFFVQWLRRMPSHFSLYAPLLMKFGLFFLYNERGGIINREWFIIFFLEFRSGSRHFFPNYHIRLFFTILGIGVCGIMYNWSLRNGFLFDGFHGVPQQAHKEEGDIDLTSFATWVWNTNWVWEMGTCLMVSMECHNRQAHKEEGADIDLEMIKTSSSRHVLWRAIALMSASQVKHHLMEGWW